MSRALFPVQHILGLATLLVLGVSPVALASMPAEGEGEELDLEALFNTQVEVATKRAQALSEAPAVVTVITAEDIRERGYTSVAEALRAVPGFYMVDDMFLPNLGVRGIPSGQRAWSRIVKVMVDGTPVPYLPEATNFLGPELIPLRLVKRIEIIRGPGSALYGADAFLGVINVVTKRGEDLSGAQVSTTVGTRAGNGRGQGEVDAGYPLPWREGEVVVGALAGLDNRSGYSVPADSAFANRFGGQTSLNDLAWPGSFFGRVGNLATPLGVFALDGAYQHVSTAGEWQDFRPFSHASRVTLENRLVHAALRSQPLERLGTTINVGYASGSPGADDRISTGNADYTIRRDMGSQGLNAAVEGLYSFDSRSSLSAGADFAHITHQLPSYFNVFTAASGRLGEQTPAGPPGDTQVFDNLGLYSQGIMYVLEDTALTVGVRMDAHSVYGNVFNSRAGLVHPFAPNLSGKILYGSSFKAPSPQQLFGRPLIFGDILGNRDLKPEQAQTVEAALLWAPLRQLDLLGNAYYTHVTDKIGFVTIGGNSRAVNQSQLDCVGLESEAKWRWNWLHGSLNSSIQATAAAATDSTSAASSAPRPESYPAAIINCGVGAPLGPLPLGAYLEGRLVSTVPATQSNFAANGLVDYELPTAFALDLTFASKEWTLGDGALSASLKLANLLDSPLAQPGFGGIDYPGVGRTLLMRLDYAW
jgi:iron complex outermembrane receptor protein